MILRIAAFAIAGLMLALGLISAATKAGLFGAPPAPTRVFAGRLALTLPPQWHLDQGEFAPIRDDVCKLVPDARQCVAYFIKGTGSPRAILALAVGPAGAKAELRPILSRDGAEASDAAPVQAVGSTGQRHRVTYKKRGRLGSLAVVDSFIFGGDRIVLEVVAEEPEGRYQETLLADIEKSFTVLDK